MQKYVFCTCKNYTYLLILYLQNSHQIIKVRFFDKLERIRDIVLFSDFPVSFSYQTVYASGLDLRYPNTGYTICMNLINL